MRNLIPSFIEKKCAEGVFSGSFTAGSLFVDISGFTAMTEQLMSHGKSGGEELSKFLNTVFTPLIAAVYRNGGFVTTFAGDAFTAIFPGADPFNACSTAQRIQDDFQKVSHFSSELGDFSLSVKIGVSHGNVSWAIPGTGEKRTYFFKGDAIDECVHAESCCTGGEMCVRRSLLEDMPGEMLVVGEERGDYVVFTVSEKQAADDGVVHLSGLDGAASDLFFSHGLYHSDITGEFRDVISMFISFKAPDAYSELEDFVRNALSITTMTGGYFNLLDFGDKGAEMLVLFGAPKSYENNAFRAMNFIELLRSRTDVEFRAGVTEGIVYAGFVGSDLRSTYTVLGDKVNLAARMMMSADWGETLLNTDVAGKVTDSFETELAGERTFKGKTQRTFVYRLGGRVDRQGNISYNTEMVGRKDEKRLLADFIHPLRSGDNAGVCSVFGEAGIGKTRLLSDVADSLSTEFNTYYISADTVIKRSLNPFTMLFERFFGPNRDSDGMRRDAFDNVWDSFITEVGDVDDERSAAVCGELRRTRSFIAAMLHIFWKNSLYDRLKFNKKTRFENTVTAIREFLKGMSLTRPLVLIFDDIHEMDDDSRTVLAQLVRQLSDFPVAIVLSGRLHDDGTRPEIDTSGTSRHREMLLERLAEDTVGTFTRLYLGAQGGASLISFLKKNTNRNPFFMEQMLLYLRENDFVSEQNGLCELRSGDIDIPTKINSLLVSRIDRLSSHLKKLVFAASVIGREFYVDILDKLVREGISDDLSSGENERIWNRENSSQFVFRNAMLRDTAYNMQLHSRLKKLHERIARLFIRTFGDDARFYSNIALHFDEAGHEADARKYYLNAAEFAEGQYQNNDAVLFYEKVLDLDSAEEDAITILSDLAGVYKRIGKWDDAERRYTESIERAKADGNEECIAEHTKRLGHFLLEKGEYARAAELLNNAKRIFTKRDHMAGLCQVEGYIGLYYYYRGELDNALEQFRRRLTIAERLENTYELALTYRWFGGVSFYRSDYEQALSYYKKNLSLVRRTENEMDEAVAYNNLGLCYSHLNDLENALKYYNKALELFEKFGSRQYVAHTMYNTAELYFLRGEFLKARELLERQLEIARELGNDRYVAMTSNMLGCIAKRTDDLDSAVRYISTAVDIASTMNLRNLLCEFYYELGDAYYAREQFDRSAEVNEKAYTIAGEVDRNEFLFASELLQGKLIAVNRLEEAIAHFERMRGKYTDTYHLAEILFWLYRTGGAPTHRSESLRRFRELYNDAGKYIFRERLEELDTK